MASSGTYTFYPDLSDIIEKAYELTGEASRSGYDLNQAIFAVDLILTDWNNRGVNLWTLTQEEITLTQDTATATLDARIIDILDATIRNSDDSPVNDLTADRITMSEYMRRPVKTTSGRPVQYTLERNASAHTLYVWPVPDTTTYSMYAWTMRYMQDAGAYDETPDVPRRFIPALIAGLAHRLCYYNRKSLIQDFGVEGWKVLKDDIKADYAELFQAAYEEDRERASLWIVPGR